MARSWTILNYNKRILFDFDSTCIPLLEMARHNNVKIYNVFFRKNCMFYLPPLQLTYDDIIKSILYSERWDNYELF